MIGSLIGRRVLWLLAGSAIGTVAGVTLTRGSKSLRPVAVGAVKEAYGAKEWLSGEIEKMKEDIQDIVAEAIHAYEQEFAAPPKGEKDEEALRELVEKIIEEKLAKMRQGEKRQRRGQSRARRKAAPSGAGEAEA